MGAILQLLLPLTQEAGSEVTVQEADLQVMLQQLKRVAQTLAQASSTQVSITHKDRSVSNEKEH